MRNKKKFSGISGIAILALGLLASQLAAQVTAPTTLSLGRYRVLAMDTLGNSGWLWGGNFVGIEDLIDSLAVRDDSLAAHRTIILANQADILALELRFESDSSDVFSSLAQKVELAALADSLNIIHTTDDSLYALIQTNALDIAGLDPAGIAGTQDTVRMLWDSLLVFRPLIYAITDTAAALRLEFPVVPDWIDTTAYDFLLVSPADSANYPFIASYSRTFVVPSDTAGNSNGVVFENLMIESQRLGKAVVNIACSFDTLFFSDSTFFDTTFTNTVRFYGVNRPGVPEYKPVFYKWASFGNYTNCFQIDSLFTVPQTISTGKMVFSGIAFHAPAAYTVATSGGIIGSLNYAEVTFAYENCYLHGAAASWYDMASTHTGDSLSVFKDCVFDTLSAYGGGTGAMTIDNCTGTVGTVAYVGAAYVRVQDSNLAVHSITGSGSCPAWVNNCSLTQLVDGSYMFGDYTYIYDCNIIGRATHSVNYVAGFRTGGNTYYRIGQSAQMVHGSRFNTCTVGVYGADYILNNSFLECTTALSNIGSATVYNNSGVLNTTWATGTPTDSLNNSWR